MISGKTAANRKVDYRFHKPIMGYQGGTEGCGGKKGIGMKEQSVEKKGNEKKIPT